MQKKLETKNLRISFSTPHGRAEALRGISFDLYKGETLAIVGESGSGKSVTSKAILGILPASARVDGGEVIYDGQDLMRLSEKGFYKIRADRIAMIFQDPMSSLNPIVKIGKQLTEAMILKGRSGARESRRRLNNYLGLLFKEISRSVGEAEADDFKMYCKELKQKGYSLDDADLVGKILSGIRLALESSAAEAYRQKRLATEMLKEKKVVFTAKKYNKSECFSVCKMLSRAVERGIDRLEISKDGIAYTFGGSLAGELERYFAGDGQNRDAARDSVISQIDRMQRHYEKKVARAKERDYSTEADELLRHLRQLYLESSVRGIKRAAKGKALKLMSEVGISDPQKRYDQYPFEFSGGMRQRIVIAIALAADPDVLICDEPTTALDVTIQAQILELINKFKRERGLSVIFITHDLGVVANMADRIAVMYAGKIVEYGTCEDIFYDPRHPYTWALLSSVPDINSAEKLEAIPGTPPDLTEPIVGDAFAPRNRYALKIDFEEEPPMFKISKSHGAATWLLHPDAPKVEPPMGIRERIERFRGEKNEK